MPFIQLLKQYQTSDIAEDKMHKDMLTFASTYPNCLERSLAAGHITTSAWITDHCRRYVLLTHHRKLNKWLQLGGHADGETDLHRSAMKEAGEESGLTAISFIQEGIFDVDIHLIPARQTEPAHYHYDIRLLMEADKREPLVVSHESKDLSWVAITQVAALNPEESIMRMVRKHKTLFGS
jgi:8-oxo-dGTP pyrophosphatase MutT (NUDIX family)